jgi:hypothetical protein
MVIRDNKGKPREKAKSVGNKQSKEEDRLASKLQQESLKVHGDPLNPPKKAPAKRRAE